MSLGKALAGLNAQSKGPRLGIFKPHEEKTTAARERKRGEQFWIELCGRPGSARNTADGVQALSGRVVGTAEGVETYLETKCGDQVEAARAAMTTLAQAYRPRNVAPEALSLYEAFRSRDPRGSGGQGAKGVLVMTRGVVRSHRCLVRSP